MRLVRRIGLLGVLGLAALLASGCGALRDAPPTVTAILITATPDLPPIPIVATETLSPSPVMDATSVVAMPTQSTLRTATPTPRPPITQTPTFTPTASDTPVTPGGVYVPVGGVSSGIGLVMGAAGAEAASAPSCGSLPPGSFGAIFQSDPTLATSIGCPLSSVATGTQSAYQPFQNGVMIWVSTLGAQSQPAIYALYNNGTYQRFNDTWTEGVDPSSGGASPPPGMQEPVRGFGKVWRENPSARDTLGWALSGEAGGSAQVLMFERGEMVSISQSGQTYIMVAGAPGTWTARSGM